jgi:hypothetical protein
VGSKFVDRKALDEGGAHAGKSLFRATYVCDACKRTWSVNETEDSPAAALSNAQWFGK